MVFAAKILQKSGGPATLPINGGPPTSPMNLLSTRLVCAECFENAGCALGLQIDDRALVSDEGDDRVGELLEEVADERRQNLRVALMGVDETFFCSCHYGRYRRREAVELHRFFSRQPCERSTVRSFDPNSMYLFGRFLARAACRFVQDPRSTILSNGASSSSSYRHDRTVVSRPVERGEAHAIF